MIIALIFLFLIIISLALLNSSIIPFIGFNTDTMNDVNTNIHNVKSVHMKGDGSITYSSGTDEWTDFTKDININNNDNFDENKIWLLQNYTKEELSSDETVTQQLVNYNDFMLDMKIIPLQDFDTLKIYWTDNIGDVVSKIVIFPINWKDNYINWNSLKISEQVWKISQIYQYYKDHSNDWIYWNIITTNSNFVSIANNSFRDPNWFLYNKEIDIKPFYNIDNNWNINFNNLQFKKHFLYYIKIYFKIDIGSNKNFKLYIPWWWYINYNNIVKTVEEKTNLSYKAIQIHIEKKWLINKINTVKNNF